MESMEEVLGLPQDVEDFTDKKVRTAHPVSMADFPKFVNRLAFVDTKHMWRTMMLDENVESMKFVLEKTFKDDNVDEVMANINAGNYPKIMDKIMKINGIIIPSADEKNVTEV